MTGTDGTVPAGRRVDFAGAVSLGFRNYVRFTGRSSRGAYWFWVLALTVAAVVAGGIDARVFPVPAGTEASGGPVQAVLALIAFLPGLALAVRRLHDIGRSGWWILIALVPVAGILVLIYWYCQPGERGENRFGPDAEAGRA